MNIKLPVADPPIKSLNHHAFYLSIILNDERMLPYLYNNFIKLKKLDWFDGRVETEPGIDESYRNIYSKGFTFRNSLDFFDASDSLDYIIELNNKMLKEGYYILGEFDEYYIPHKSAYRRFHFVHNYLIVGVCEEERYYYAMGYNNINGQLSKYGEQKITFEEYKNALAIRKEAYSTDGLYWRSLNYLQYKYPETGCELNPAKIREQLNNFVGSGEYNPEPDEGINMFQYMADHINDHTFDLRNYRMIMEHANIMSDRAKFMNEKGLLNNYNLLSEKLLTVKKTAEILFNLSIKYLIGGNARIIEQIRSTLNKLSVLEQDALGGFVYNLKI